MEENKTSKPEGKQVGINEIMSLIPHRYPFLLVDRITDSSKDSIVGIKNVTINEPQFMGHFPSRPVMPGVLMIEAMAQLSAVLVARSMNNTKDIEVFFMAVEEAKFRRVVEPGDCLVMYSTVIQSRSSVWKFRARAEVEGKIASEAVFTAMIKDKNSSK